MGFAVIAQTMTAAPARTTLREARSDRATPCLPRSAPLESLRIRQSEAQW